MMEFNKDEIFLVTGGNSGIGRSVAVLLNKLGATVIVVGRNQDSLKQTKDGSSFPCNLYTESRDLMQNLATLPQWVNDIANKYGKLKGLVLSAGMSHTSPIIYESLAESLNLFNLNYFCNIELCKGFLSSKVHRIGGSSIVFISSITSIQGIAGIVSYSASKGAINSAVKSLAIEGAKKLVRVNAILPGLVKTELFDKEKNIMDADFIKKNEELYPLGLGTPEDISNAVAFLLSDCSRWMTGQHVVIDGGRTLQ